MGVIAFAALIANAMSMWLLARHRHGGAHMKASWIFTTNDVIANIGVILAAGLVGVLHSKRAGSRRGDTDRVRGAERRGTDPAAEGVSGRLV